MAVQIPYGYADGVDTEWCIADAGSPGYMLCGRRVGFVPVVPPLFPQVVHKRCRDKWFRTEGARVAEPATGACPACGGEVVVRGGRIQSHGELRVGGDGEPHESGVRCPGVNMRPKR
jgi:hypothetical protein